MVPLPGRGRIRASIERLPALTSVRLPGAATAIAIVVLAAAAFSAWLLLERSRDAADELSARYLTPLAGMADSRALVGETDSYLVRSLTDPRRRPSTVSLETRAEQVADRNTKLIAHIRASLPDGPEPAGFQDYVVSWDLYRSSVQRLLNYVRSDRIDLATVEYFRSSAPIYARLDRQMAAAMEEVRAAATERITALDGAVRVGQGTLVGLFGGAALALVAAAFMTLRFIRRIELQGRLLDEVHSAVFITDLDDRVTYWNQGAERMYGWSALEAKGHRIRDLVSDSPELSLEIEQSTLAQGGRWQGVVRDRCKDGRRIYAEIRTSPLIRPGLGASGAITVALDVSDREHATQRLREMAHRDSLTGLGNRALLHERLSEVIEEAEATGDDGSVALLYLDLVRFKEINDAFGHEAGDSVLRHVARCLASSVREVDTVARLGGDEFAVVLGNVHSRSEVRVVAERIAATLADGVTIEVRDVRRHVESQANIGVAFLGPDGRDAESLLRAADVAMYEAKRVGTPLVFYAPERGEESRQRSSRAQELRRAIAESQMVLHYQPQVRLSDGRVVAYEALVRWLHPRDGLLAPAAFVPLAEQTGVIDPLSRWVVKQALTDLRSMQKVDPEIRIAVNLSATNLRDPAFMRWLTQRVRQLKEPNGLRLELTETVISQATSATLKTLARLRALGVSISLDDFGTGYSSLSVLRDLPLDELKIDGSFIAKVRTNDRDQRIVQSIVELALRLELEVVAEAVEDLPTAVKLREFGCHSVQGFAFGRPLPLQDLDLSATARHPLPRLVRPA